MTQYADGETRPRLEEVAYFLPQSYVVRLFPTALAATRFYPCSAKAKKPELFREPADLARAFTITQLKTHLRELTTRRLRPLYDARDNAAECPDHDPSSSSSVALALWHVLQLVGDRVCNEPGSKPEKLNLYKFDLVTAGSAEGREAWGKLPKQAKQIMAEVLAISVADFTDKQAEDLMKSMVKSGRLKTKQDPFRIFQFYAPALAALGLVEYAGRRVREESDDDPAEEAGAA